MSWYKNGNRLLYTSQISQQLAAKDLYPVLIMYNTGDTVEMSYWLVYCLSIIYCRLLIGCWLLIIDYLLLLLIMRVYILFIIYLFIYLYVCWLIDFFISWFVHVFLYLFYLLLEFIDCRIYAIHLWMLCPLYACNRL